MNRVICDICGTTYPEAANQCPICGCAKPENAAALSDDMAVAEGAAAYNYVKGGRFSNANVRKRMSTAAPAVVQDEDGYLQDAEDEDQPRESSSNGGLIVVVIILLLAIIAAIGYIYFSFFAPNMGKDSNVVTTGATTTAATSTATEEPTIPCESLEVSKNDIVLEAIGDAWLLNAVAAPADTTDKITYSSADESVATVTDEGCITAVGAGQTVITVTCGDVVVKCNVTCNEATVPTTEEVTEPPTEAPTEPALKWGFSTNNFVLYPGESWQLYRGEVPAKNIVFKSSDESIATISSTGFVEYVSQGAVTLTARYNGETIYCGLTCRPPKATTPPDDATTGATTGSDEGNAVG